GSETGAGGVLVPTASLVGVASFQIDIVVALSEQWVDEASAKAPRRQISSGQRRPACRCEPTASTRSLRDSCRRFPRIAGDARRPPWQAYRASRPPAKPPPLVTRLIEADAALPNRLRSART